MSERAKYVIIRSGTVQAYEDRHGGAVCALELSDGPEAAARSANGFSHGRRFLASTSYEGGYLIDFDERLLIVFGEPYVDLDGVAAEFGMDEFDPGPTVTALLEQGPAAYFEAIAPLYPGWTLRWNELGVDAFIEHLSRRNLIDQVDAHPDRFGSDDHVTAELVVAP